MKPRHRIAADLNRVARELESLMLPGVLDAAVDTPDECDRVQDVIDEAWTLIRSAAAQLALVAVPL